MPGSDLLKIKIPKVVNEIISRLNTADFEAYIVGGVCATR